MSHARRLNLHDLDILKQRGTSAILVLLQPTT